MIQRTEGKKTVPQIFINNKSIGGCNELYQLESESKLNFYLVNLHNLYIAIINFRSNHDSR